MARGSFQRLLTEDAPPELKRLEAVRQKADAMILELMSAIEAAARVAQPFSAPTRTQLLTIEQVCERLQCKRDFVGARIKDGSLLSRKLGGMLRIAESDLEAFMDGGVR